MHGMIKKLELRKLDSGRLLDTFDFDAAPMISKAQAQVLAFLSARLVGSSGETEKSVRKMHFSRRAGFEHEALPLVDHSHDLEALVASPLSLVKMLKQEGRSRLPVLRGISTTLTRRV
jgi:hypothetical protein